MSTFVNTVESVGDEALANSIIDRSITEIMDNLLTTIGYYAFNSCKALKKINFQNVTDVKQGAFGNCTALNRGDFGTSVVFAQSAFAKSGLTTLIVRGAPVEINTYAFSNTYLATTGYIYVPAEYVASYKTTTGYTSYAERIRAIEDYPEICDPYTWEYVAQHIAAGDYATVYKVGDVVPLDLGSEGVINMQIAAIDTDDKADGSGKAPITWIAQDLLATKHCMNPTTATSGSDGTFIDGTGSVGGWAACAMRTYLSETIKPLMPSAVQEMLVSVTKTGNGSNMPDSTDELWIPSYAETESEGTYRALLGTTAQRTKSDAWWLRSGVLSYSFHAINAAGATNAGNAGLQVATNENGILLCFCTG